MLGFTYRPGDNPVEKTTKPNVLPNRLHAWQRHVTLMLKSLHRKSVLENVDENIIP